MSFFSDFSFKKFSSKSQQIEAIDDWRFKDGESDVDGSGSVGAVEYLQEAEKHQIPQEIVPKSELQHENMIVGNSATENGELATNISDEENDFNTFSYSPFTNLDINENCAAVQSSVSVDSCGQQKRTQITDDLSITRLSCKPSSSVVTNKIKWNPTAGTSRQKIRVEGKIVSERAHCGTPSTKVSRLLTHQRDKILEKKIFIPKPLTLMITQPLNLVTPVTSARLNSSVVSTSFPSSEPLKRKNGFSGLSQLKSNENPAMVTAPRVDLLDCGMEISKQLSKISVDTRALNNPSMSLTNQCTCISHELNKRKARLLEIDAILIGGTLFAISKERLSKLKSTLSRMDYQSKSVSEEMSH